MDSQSCDLEEGNMHKKSLRFPTIAALALLAGLALALAAPALAQDDNPGTVYTTRSVFMRAGPAVTWHVVATLPGGEQLTVLDRYTNWYQVQRADGTQGWVSGTYLTIDPPGSGGGGGAAGGALVAKPPSAGTFSTVNTPLLNIRSGAGVDNPVIGTVKGGETVTVLASDRQWRLIRTAGGVQGWVNSYYLSASLGPAADVGGGGVVTGSPTGASLGGSLAIREVVFDHAVRDSSRPGGAVVTIRIDFTGGSGPYGIASDGFQKASGLTPSTRVDGDTTIGAVVFTELSECGGTMVHTVTLSAASGESVSQGYYVHPVICPND
jgi:SH3-like domain-containing protein